MLYMLIGVLTVFAALWAIKKFDARGVLSETPFLVVVIAASLFVWPVALPIGLCAVAASYARKWLHK